MREREERRRRVEGREAFDSITSRGGGGRRAELHTLFNYLSFPSPQFLSFSLSSISLFPLSLPQFLPLSLDQQIFPSSNFSLHPLLLSFYFFSLSLVDAMLLNSTFKNGRNVPFNWISRDTAIFNEKKGNDEVCSSFEALESEGQSFYF